MVAPKAWATARQTRVGAALPQRFPYSAWTRECIADQGDVSRSRVEPRSTCRSQVGTTLRAAYPMITCVIACHHDGLCRHMYTARLWPTINNGRA